MGLQELYQELYGSPGIDPSITKLAEAFQVTEIEMAEALYDEGLIDEKGNWLEVDEESEKVAEGFDTAGRILARSLINENSEKIAVARRGLGGVTGLLKRMLIGRVGERLPKGGAQAIGRAISERKYPLAIAGGAGYMIGRRGKRRK